MKKKDFENKKILVTGASSGIGRQIAVDLSQRGAKLVLVARRESELCKTISLLSGEGHTYHSLDVGDFDAMVNLVKIAVKADGVKFDGAVHSAGFVRVTPLRQISFDYLVEHADVHFNAFVAILKCAASKRYFNNSSSIVGLSSSASKFGEKSNSIYAAMKAAMNNMAKSAAAELKDRGIRVNTVCPQLVDTELLIGIDLEFDRNQVLSAKEVSDVVVTLLSDDITAVSGDNINIGFTAVTKNIKEV